MEEDEQATQDSLSGYASGDALDPSDWANRDRTAGGEAGEERDAMSGYASADLFDEQASPDRNRTA
jgi:hypothetical protein